MTPFFVLVGFVIGIVVSYTLVTRRHRSKFLAQSEYWVYTAVEKMPAQELLLDQIVGKNPYKKNGRGPIGPVEGLVLSDVRLHIALVLRRKNPNIFRQDLFEEIDVTAEHLASMAASNAIVKLRFVSEEPLKDKRHLQFLIHAADAMAVLTGSNLIYDATARRLITKQELSAILSQDLDATRPEIHVAVRWRDIPSECTAETHGLRKIGLDELKTGPMEADEKVLILQVIDLALEQLWTMNALPPEVDVEAFGDKFRLMIGQVKEGYAPVRILRMQAT